MFRALVPSFVKQNFETLDPKTNYFPTYQDSSSVSARLNLLRDKKRLEVNALKEDWENMEGR